FYISSLRNIMNFYGHIPDAPDQRDHLFSVSQPTTLSSIDLTPQMPPVYDQGQLGSCTANAIAAALQFDGMREKHFINSLMPSRLFIYYNERDMEGTINSDSGAQIRDGIKSVNSLGSPPEFMWSYNIK